MTALFSVSAHAAPRIVVLGDSLSAAYGIEQSEGWVALLQAQLADKGYAHELINLSVSGETSAGGMRRLPAALQTYAPKLVLLELGANDGLQGLSLDRMSDNLTRMIALSQAAGAQVLLFEMRIPPNYGARYTAAFQAKYRQIAQAQKVTFLPFFLTPIALNPQAFQEDGIHPTAASQPALLLEVWPVLEKMLGPKATAAAP